MAILQGSLVLEYSQSQKAWHIDQIEELINRNLLAYLENRLLSDYAVMGVGSTHEELLALQVEIISTWKSVRLEDKLVEREASPKESIFSKFAKIFKMRNR